MKRFAMAVNIAAMVVVGRLRRGYWWRDWKEGKEGKWQSSQQGRVAFSYIG